MGNKYPDTAKTFIFKAGESNPIECCMTIILLPYTKGFDNSDHSALLPLFF